jgi:hypothetical protein
VRAAIFAMLQVLNRTRLAAAPSLAFGSDGAELLSVVVKGTFSLPTGRDGVRLADEQEPPRYADEYWGDPADSSIRYPADFAPIKVGTDVLLVGSAHTADGRPATRLEASIRIGPVSKRIVVTGDRTWEKRAISNSYVLSSPISFTEMPLVYERAFGGADRSAPDPADHDWDTHNPVGAGFRVDRDALDGTPAPNLEDPDHLIGSWQDRPPAAGFGPLAVGWEPRARYAGTYDDEWLTTRAPLPPSDLQPAFYNAAPPDLVAPGFLVGNEMAELTNVSPAASRLAFRLPDLGVLLTLHVGRTVETFRADLWTVLFEPDAHRLCLVWGHAFSVGKQPSRVRAIEVDADGRDAADVTT